MNVPLLDLKIQYQQIKKEIDDAVQSVVDSQHFIMGSAVGEFENDMAGYIGAKHAVGVASGSDALLIALMALDIKPGDKVITTTFSFFATAGSIVRAGAVPIFVDIDPRTFNLDPAAVADAVKKHTPVKAIMPVHLYGQSADMDPIMDIARKYNLAVIEDAAQAIGAVYTSAVSDKGDLQPSIPGSNSLTLKLPEYNNRKVGTIGALGCFSFFPSKNLGGWGDGGLITTNDDKLAELARKLRLHGSTKKYYHQLVGMNSRLDTLQAAVLRVKLKYLDGWSAKRAEKAQYYNKLFKDNGLLDIVSTPYVMPQPPCGGAHLCNHIYHQYTIRVAGGKRDALRDYLKQNNIGTEVYYPLPLHLQECFTERERSPERSIGIDLGYKNGDLPVAEQASLDALSLPIYPELTDAQQEYVVECIRKFVLK